MKKSDPETASLIAQALSRLSAFVRMSGWQVAREQGLTPTQADILMQISRRGPMRGGALAAMQGITPATLSDSVGALVAKRLVRRDLDPQDARASLVVLTPEGAATVAALPKAPQPLIAVLDAMPADNSAALLRMLVKVILGLQEARAIPVQRMCVTCRHFRPHAHADAQTPHHCAFVDAAFGDAGLRIDCGDHEDAPADQRARLRARFDAAA